MPSSSPFSNTDPVSHLNERLQHHLKRNLNWNDLRDIQKRSIPPIAGGKQTLIVSETASGKTEAALIPIISQLLNGGFEGLKVLYLAPLKALINDLCDRIENLAKPLGINTSPWHGDIPSSEKIKSLEDTHLLIITPESLEGMLTSKKIDLRAVFEHLEYVIVDEIHYFADSPRGYQLISLINRLEKYSKHTLQRIGLSATVENKEAVLEFLSHGSDRECEVVRSRGNQHRREIKVVEVDDSLSMEAIIEKSLRKEPQKKYLVFSNSRTLAETFSADLHDKKIHVEVHHASVGKEIRATVEKLFKQKHLQVVVATTTLELGIDIGDIDQVFFLNPPYSTSSFLQRLGRCGRLDANPKCWIRINRENTHEILRILGIHYMLEHDRVESVPMYDYCPQLFSHQLLSAVYELGFFCKEDLTALKRAYGFRNMNLERLACLFKFLVEEDYLYKKDNRYAPSTKLLDMMESFRKRDFVGVFSATTECDVENEGRKVGTVPFIFFEQIKRQLAEDKSPAFRLANRSWKVVAISEPKKKIFVAISDQKNVPLWYSRGASISFDFAQAIKEKLSQDFSTLDEYLHLMKVSKVSKEVIACVVNEEKEKLKHDSQGLHSDFQIGEVSMKKWHNYFGEKGNFLTKCLMEICGMSVESYDYSMIQFTCENVSATLDRFKALISREESLIRGELLVFLQNNPKLAEGVYELFGDKLMTFLPDRLIADFAVMFIYDQRVMELLKKAV